MGYQPLTSVILVQCSRYQLSYLANWAWLRYKFVIYTLHSQVVKIQVDVKNIMHLNSRERYEDIIYRHSYRTLYTTVKLKIEKNIQA